MESNTAQATNSNGNDSSPSKTTILRFQGLPSDAEQRSKIEGCIRNADGVESVEVLPNCVQGNGYIALVEWRGGSDDKPFGCTFKTPGETNFVELAGVVLRLDQDFWGFTQLYEPSDPNSISADIIAISGLDAHAYGSFRGAKTGHMWLRDFLKRDLPSCRTMLWGYDIKLAQPADHSIADYSSQFFEQLRKIRPPSTKKRPLILVAFSFGGLILVHALVKSKLADNLQSDEAKANFHKSVYGFLFFGTPHKGMYVEDILNQLSDVGQEGRKRLVEFISESVNSMAEKLDDFKDMICNRQIISFVEMHKTRELEQIGDKLQRLGPYRTLVNQDSARLQLQSEHSVSLNTDHRNLAKFDDPGDDGYSNAVYYLQRLVKDAPEAVRTHWHNEPAVKHENFYEIPDKLVKGYISRKAPLEDISKLFAVKTEDGRPVTVALRGTGGAGKTQLALKYCKQAQANGEYGFIIWLNAASPRTLDQDKTTIMSKIYPDYKGPECDRVPVVHDMLQKSGRKWLVILDNMDDPDRFREGLKKHLPHGDNGRILITSQRGARKLGEYVDNVIEAEKVTQDEGLELLFAGSKAKRSEQDEDEARRLLERLGYLAYPIHCAAAFIADGIMSVQQYLGNLTKVDPKAFKSILDIRGDPNYTKVNESDLDKSEYISPSVYETFELSLQAFEKAMNRHSQRSSGAESLPHQFSDTSISSDDAGSSISNVTSTVTSHTLSNTGRSDSIMSGKTLTEATTDEQAVNSNYDERALVPLENNDGFLGNSGREKLAGDDECEILIRVLMIGCHLYTASIPTEWFQVYAERCIKDGNAPSWVRNFMTDGKWDEVKFALGLNKLIDFTLVQRVGPQEQSKTGAFSLHSVMRLTLKIRMDEKTSNSTLLEAMRLLWYNWEHALDVESWTENRLFMKFMSLIFSTITGFEEGRILDLEGDERVKVLDKVHPKIELLQQCAKEENADTKLLDDISGAKGLWNFFMPMWAGPVNLLSYRVRHFFS